MSKRAVSGMAAIVIGAGGILSAAGCGSSSGGGGGEGGGDGNKKPSISIVSFGSNAYYAEYNKGFEAEAKKLGLSVDIKNAPSFDAAAVTATINAATATRPDYLLAPAIDSAALRAPLLAASKRGIKVITFDTQVDDPDFVTAYVNANYREYGERSGSAISELIGGKGKVLLTLIVPGNAALHDFTTGFKSKLPAGVELLPLQYSNAEDSKGSSILRATLTRHPDLAGVVAFSGFGGEGTISALEQSGKAGTVKAVMTSASKQALRLLEKGSVQTIVGERLQGIGEAAVNAAYQDANGKTPPKVVDVPLCTITKATIDSAEARPCERR